MKNSRDEGAVALGSSQGSSSSDSESELSDVGDVHNQEPDRNNATDYSKEWKEQRETLKDVDSMESVITTQKIDKLVPFLKIIYEKHVNIYYEDVTPSLSNGTPFIVDGDMLLVHAMADANYSKHMGGQTLHLIYLCERRLQFFKQKGGIFQIVFFKKWSEAWEAFPEVQLHHTVLLNHFLHNTKYTVFEFNSIWDEDFKQHLDIFRPSFILMDLHTDHYPESLFVELVFYWHVLCALYSSVLCIDLNDLKLDISTLIAFNATPKFSLKILLRRNFPKILQHLESCFPETQTETFFSFESELGSLQTASVENFVVVSTASSMLLEKNIPCDLIRAYLVYSAVKSVLPLSSRGFCDLKFVPKELSSFICLALRKMNIALCEAVRRGLDMTHIADVWQGNLFSSILVVLSTSPTTETSVIWSNAVSSLYRELVVETCQLAHTSMPAFPVLTGIEWLSELEFVKPLAEDEVAGGKRLDVLPVSCSVVEQFCLDSLLQPIHFTRKETATIMQFYTKNSEFDEIRHYHSRLPLTDEVDRTPDSWNNEKSADPWVQKKIDRNNQMFVRFLEKYGMNMEGNILQPRPIVCVQNQKSSCNKKSNGNQKNEKKIKVSKKAQEIINKKKIADDKKREDEEKNELKLFVQQFKVMMTSAKYSQALDKIDELLQRFKLQQSKCKVVIRKAEVFRKMWGEVCSTGDKRDLTYAKKLFIELKAILQLVKKEGLTLSDNDLKNIAKWLVELGCDEIALKCGLSIPHNARKDLTTGKSWIEFQLEHLGPELDRTTSNIPDSRIEGFIPDDWQRKLFDIVDKKQSALVVAPTSSGKTYASYYCMESVLRESNDGIVVYVSPTKALVNQVHATVYAKFKHKTMPPGKAVCGVFTRDYQFRAMDCQILVTVPQCLEVLLLSARRHDWVLRLRYVILDEIHCLAGQAGGIAWERCLLMIRCPFLALSATVGQPETFQQWLQDVEYYKAQRDAADNFSRPTDSYKVELVVHTDRHSDLIKYTYCGGVFKHVHPYAFVDLALAAGRGIPNHVTLSPSETLQLYNIMSSVDSDMTLLKPDNFFSASDTGFVTRSMVRNYEQQLKSKLEFWARNDNEKYQMVHMHLSHGLNVPAESSPKEEVIEECSELAMALKQKEMLPALVFSYSRDLIEIACISLADDCKRLAVTEIPRKQTKYEQREQRKALEELENIPKHWKHKSLKLLEGPGYFRKVGTVDSEDLKFVELRLLKERLTHNSEFIEGLRQGVSYHHGGLSRTKKSAVEMMFRLKVLSLVYATGTLALGIHMPCRTVVLAGDSHYINSLEYHQMSGRAGRRGYDTSGNVVFMGLGSRKIKTLMTDDFPVMKGNFPLTVGTVLRLLLLVARVTSNSVQSPAVTRDALSRVLTLLNCSMVYKDRPEMKIQMRYFFAFASVMLMCQGFIDEFGRPQVMSSIVTHLHYHEPGNLALVFLFRTGVLRQLCHTKRNGAISKQTELDLVMVLSYLFAYMPLHSSFKNVKCKNSLVKLPSLPTYIKETLEEYNKQVKFVFNSYFKSISQHCEETMGTDNKLPLSGVVYSPPVAKLQGNSLERKLAAMSGTRTICSAFAALSGNKDTDLYSETELISNIRHQVFTDMKVVPLVDLKTPLNGYAWDFYNHGIVPAIRRDNKLKAGAEFDKLKDFSLVLKAITVTLEDLEPRNRNDDVVRTFRSVTDKFSKLIRKGFGGGA